MSRFSLLPRTFVRGSTLIGGGQGSTRKEIVRSASHKPSRKEPTLEEALTAGLNLPGVPHGAFAERNETLIGDKGDVLVGSEIDEDEYSFTSRKSTSELTEDDKAYLDRFRPKVDPRLSKVFRGYNSLDEQGWTINYSKLGWYSMKQIYGHYDDNDERSVYYIHPRSTIMRVLRDPFVPKKYAFDNWKEKRDCDLLKRYQLTNVEKLHTLGPELMAAHFVTLFGGKVKFHGYQNWFDKTNFKSMPQLFAKEFVCEAIDLSNTPLFYEGMTFLMRLSDLRSLNLANCTALDEWAINRLHPLRKTLVHLDLSGCHGMSDRGLVTLWRMKNLKRLVLSGLDDSINNLGLIATELEEALPDCFIHGVDFEAPPKPKVSGIPEDYDPENVALSAQYGNDVVNIEYEKWWGLKGQTFNHETFKYRWRGRVYRDDFEDWKEDIRDEAGWLWRIWNFNPFAPPKELPKRRI